MKGFSKAQVGKVDDIFIYLFICCSEITHSRCNTRICVFVSIAEYQHKKIFKKCTIWDEIFVTM